ncbi:MAG: tetratricopeptide repeat protein, partial [Planctomycetes bacterium]|nr:tetratricopeptide repeat protein [Planctomycetota bacterium]
MEAMLRERLEGNSEDAWAWSELGHLLFDQIETLPADARGPLVREVERAVAECERTAPRGLGTLALKARTAESRGLRGEAVAAHLQALDAEPEREAVYRALWESSRDAPAVEKARIRGEAERALLRTVGPLQAAETLAGLVAQRFGLEDALASLERWRKRSPDDPELDRAAAETLLDFGRSRESAERAAALLSTAVGRFPMHAGLRFSQAHAFHKLGRGEDEIRALRAILDRSPGADPARCNLARALWASGAAPEALAALDEGIGLDPLEESLRTVRADLLWQGERFDEALETLRAALARIPESMRLREVLVQRLLERGKGEEAVRAAKEGAERFPDGAFLWVLLGDAHKAGGRPEDLEAAGEAYRKALELNASLYRAAEERSLILAGQSRFDEARAVLEAAARLPESEMFASGRRAWLERRAGDAGKGFEIMAAALRKFPSYEWGWSQTLEWIREDEAWGRIQDLETLYPPELREDPNLSGQRLMILEKAGTARDRLDGEWARLIAVFPDDEPLATRRFDVLWDRGDRAGAAAALDAFEKTNEGSTYLRARRVKALAHARDLDGALRDALWIWERPGEDEGWPEASSWESLEGAGATRKALRAVEGRLRAGAPLRRAALLGAVESAGKLDDERAAGLLGNLREFVWPPSRTAGLRRLLDALGRAPGDASEAEAAVLDALTDRKAHRAVRRFLRKNRPRCETRRHLWAAVGRSLLDSGRTLEARRWFANWRAVPDVPMWALANAVLAMGDRGGPLRRVRADPEEMFRTCREALDKLAHDHTAAFLALSLCEASLRTVRDADFLAARERHEPLLKAARGAGGTEERGHWLPAGGAAAA